MHKLKPKNKLQSFFIGEKCMFLNFTIPSQLQR